MEIQPNVRQKNQFLAKLEKQMGGNSQSLSSATTVMLRAFKILQYVQQSHARYHQ